MNDPIKELAGHAAMCVRFKLRKDQKDLEKRSLKMTDEQRRKVFERIERGIRTIVWLQRTQQPCQHKGATYPSPTDKIICCDCGEEVRK